MTKRSNWCEFDKEERKYIKKRDKERCVICGNKGALQIMHIFLNRSHGGKGCKENGVLSCVKCHSILDNPIGEEQTKKSKFYQVECENYLVVKENLDTRFKTRQDLINYLKFDKTEYLREQEEKVPKLMAKDNCKKCVYFVKDRRNNSSIPTYFCKKKRCIVSKNKEICNNFRKGDKYE